MQNMRQFLRTLLVALPTNPELLVAQAGAFTRQVPLLYVLVLVNMTALAITHLPTAPVELTIIGPAFFTAVSIGRLVVWWRRRTLTITPLAAARMLRTTTLIATGLGLLFVAWSISLFPYGGYYEHAQITFFIAVTTIGCMFCLMHFRPAALALVASVLLPAAFFLATRESGVLIAIALNLLLSLVVLVIVLFKNTRDFEDLVASRQVLARREAEAMAQARLDTLTGLPNRLGFLEFLERTARQPAVLLDHPQRIEFDAIAFRIIIPKQNPLHHLGQLTTS